MQYSNRIVHRRKHPVKVVNAENSNRIMDYAWHDVNGHTMKGSLGGNTALCYRVSSPIPDSIIVDRG